MAGRDKDDKQKLIDAYKMVGLDDHFSQAIVDGGNAKYIIATWKADWRGGKSAEHPAIKAVLVGHATPEEAKSLLEASEVHNDLVSAVASGDRSMKWAHTVLSCGFKGKPEAVTALLNGADPEVLGDLLDVTLDKSQARIIGQKMRKKSANKDVNQTNPSKMSKKELISTLLNLNVAYSGKEQDLRDRFNRFLAILDSAIKGIANKKFKYNLDGLATKQIYSYQYVNGYQSRVWGWKKVENKETLNLKSLRKAAGHLKIMKPATKSKNKLIIEILQIGLNLNRITEDRYYEILDDLGIDSNDSDFSKN